MEPMFPVRHDKRGGSHLLQHCAMREGWGGQLRVRFRVRFRVRVREGRTNRATTTGAATTEHRLTIGFGLLQLH